MSLLTDDEIDAAWARSPQNNLRDYAKEIEAAVIRKLAMQMKLGASGTSIEFEEMAKRCFQMADAMIAEGSK